MTLPMENTTEFAMAQANFSITEPGPGRTATVQGGYQFLALVITLVVAIVGGAVTGKTFTNNKPKLVDIYNSKKNKT